jgi:hypothetical protein
VSSAAVTAVPGRRITFKYPAIVNGARTTTSPGSPGAASAPYLSISRISASTDGCPQEPSGASAPT